MNRPGLVAQEDTAQDETTAHEAPVQTDLDLEMAGWPLLLASAVMMVQYVFARIQIDDFDSDPRIDAYRVVVGGTDPESTDIPRTPGRPWATPRLPTSAAPADGAPMPKRAAGCS